MKKNSTKTNKQAHQPVASPETHAEDPLSRLPDELILEIIGYLLKEPGAYSYNRHKKIHQGYTLLSGEQSRLWIYEHKPKSPIMTDFQAFSVVNRKIHSICGPIMWKSLNFPSLISGPMTFWNSQILPKYGSHVKALDVLLRSKWLEKPEKPICIKQAIKNKTSRYYSLRSSDIKETKFIKEDKEYWEVDRVHSDNLALYSDRGMRDFLTKNAIRTLFGLCPENFVKVLSQCENLTTLCLGTPEWGLLSLKEMHSLGCNLSAIFSALQSLQHLKIRGHKDAPMFAECLTEPLKHLPLLESLELEYLMETEMEDGGSLLESLSNLKSLKKLALRRVHMIHNPTDSHQGPPQLVSLTVDQCDEFCISNTSCLVNSWSPHLTHLEAEFDDTCKTHSVQFSLLALTHLKIWCSSDLDSLECFSYCKNLSHLTFVQFRPDRLSKLLDSLISDHFPKLKTLSLLTTQRDFSIASIVACQMFPIDVFCKSKGIELKIFYNEVHYGNIYDGSMLFVTQD